MFTIIIVYYIFLYKMFKFVYLNCLYKIVFIKLLSLCT